MHSFLFLFSLFSLLALPRALDSLNFPFPSTDDSINDIFSSEPALGGSLPWDGSVDRVSDPSFLLVSDCSAFASAPRRRRARRRRRGSSDVCTPPGNDLTGSAGESGQPGENVPSGNSQENGLDANSQPEDVLEIPALAPYSNPRHDDCFRLSQGQLPLAVCDLNNSGASPDYFIDGLPYWDLMFSYPSKELPSTCFKMMAKATRFAC